MERLPFIPCDERQRANCKYGPNCENLSQTEHHLRPRRLLGFARQEKKSLDYQRKLKRLVTHPNNIVLVGRCIHDYLDKVTSDLLPVEAEIDHTLEVWHE